MSFTAPALITTEHQVESFDCGKESLNQYLKRFALTNTAAGTARTFVSTAIGTVKVLGYYSLAAASVEKARVSERVAKGIPNHPVPGVLLARLAADKTAQGKGLGKGLLRDALRRAVSAANVIGIRMMLVHAKDAEAKRFYLHFGFVESPVDPFLLMILMKDITRALPAG